MYVLCADERPWTTPIMQDWTLQIKYVQARDAGLYECQVSVHPPTSIFIYLNVVGTYIMMDNFHFACILSLFPYRCRLLSGYIVVSRRQMHTIHSYYI